jgi:hypothetical protein
MDYLAVREVLAGGAEVGAVDGDDDGLKWIRARTPDVDDTHS